jgi:hypothetical protein
MTNTNKINEAISKKVLERVEREADELFMAICNWSEKNPIKASSCSDDERIFARHYHSLATSHHLSSSLMDTYQPFVDAAVKMVSKWKQARHNYLFEKAAKEIIEKANIFLPECLK